MSERYIFLRMASSKEFSPRGETNYSTMMELRHIHPPYGMAIVPDEKDDDDDDDDEEKEVKRKKPSSSPCLPSTKRKQTSKPVRLSKEVMFLVSATIVLFTSGGLILGFGPIYSSLLDENQWQELCGQDENHCPQQEIRLQYVYSTSFLCLSAANAFFGIFLDMVGPRLTVALGLSMSILGNFLMAYGDSHLGHGSWIIAGYALIGAGGMGTYLASFQILQLYHLQGIVCSTLSSLFNCSGYVYMSLRLHGITRELFFKAYGSIVVGLLCIAFVLFPVKNIAKPANFMRIAGLSCEMPTFNTPVGLLKAMKTELRRADLWYFAVFFGWISLLFAFAGGAIPSIINRLASADGSGIPESPGSDNEIENTTDHIASLFVNYLYPLLANGTFVYSPIVGFTIDRYGFKVVFVVTISLVQLFVAFLLIPSLKLQLVTFVLYAMAQASLYALQFAYIMIVFPTELYGCLQAFLAMISFSFGLLNYFFNPWTQTSWHGDCTPVLMMLGIPTFLFYFFIHVIKGCEEYTIEDSYDENDDEDHSNICEKEEKTHVLVPFLKKPIRPTEDDALLI